VYLFTLWIKVLFKVSQGIHIVSEAFERPNASMSDQVLVLWSYSPDCPRGCVEQLWLLRSLFVTCGYFVLFQFCEVYRNVCLRLWTLGYVTILLPSSYSVSMGLCNLCLQGVFALQIAVWRKHFLKQENGAEVLVDWLTENKRTSATGFLQNSGIPLPNYTTLYFRRP
jgi:hypothetical protein